MQTPSGYHTESPKRPATQDDGIAGLVTILDYVRANGPTTRPRLVEATGLSRAVVTQRVTELLDHGLLENGELGPSTGGRAPRIVHFRAGAGHLLAADLGATSTSVAVIHPGGKIPPPAPAPPDTPARPAALP